MTERAASDRNDPILFVVLCVLDQFRKVYNKRPKVQEASKPQKKVSKDDTERFRLKNIMSFFASLISLGRFIISSSDS